MSDITPRGVTFKAPFHRVDELKAYVRANPIQALNCMFYVDDEPNMYVVSPNGGLLEVGTAPPNLVFCGAKLFQLKATHGLPLGDAVRRIIVQGGLRIDWVGFVVEARQNGWYDFQTVQEVTEALEDADVPRVFAKGILLRLKCYIQNNPLPR